VAASFLARRDARTSSFVGCGVQARAHVAAISAVRELERAFVFDLDEQKAESFAQEMRTLHRFDVVASTDLRGATRQSGIVVTTTSAKSAFLGPDDISPGTFVAAVGADNEHKHEIEVDLLRASVVIADDVAQCATIGDLHHAIDAGVISQDEVRATLDEVVAGVKPGRLDEDEVIVFDSTGIAIEDVAAASIAYERALAENAGLTVPLAD
jgi:ornithine cyclodeaminase/alanine dehydrogenase-like protein (mu-crystallin family)